MKYKAKGTESETLIAEVQAKCRKYWSRQGNTVGWLEI